MASADGATGENSASIGANPWPVAVAVLAGQLRRFLWLIVAVSLIFVLIGVVARTLIPKSYKATVQLLVDPRGFHVFSSDLQVGQLDANAAINFVESQMGVVKSDRVLLRVVREQRALDNGDESASVSKTNEASNEHDDTKALAKLQRAIAVQRLERSFIINVTASDPSPQRAATLANAVVKTYLDEDVANRSVAMKRLTTELTSRLEGLRQSVRESEDRVEAFRIKNGLVGVGDKPVIEQRLTEATTALTLAESREAQLRSKLAQLANPSSQMSAIGALGSDPESRSLYLLLDSQASARNDLEQLSGAFGERHPAVLNARSRLKETERSINAAIGGMRKAAQSQLEQVQTESSFLSRKVTGLSAELSKARQAEIGLRTLQADAEAQRKILESFETRSREAGEFGQIDATNLRIVSPARAPVEQGRLKGLAVWGLSGGVVGAMLSICAIGFALVFRRNDLTSDLAQDEAIANPAAQLSSVLAPVEDQQQVVAADPQREGFSAPDGAFAAAMKAFYKSCRGGGVMGFGKKRSVSVLVTSAEVGPDNTTVAANLAWLAASDGRRAILIDVEPASPTLAAMVAPDAPARLIRLAGKLRPIYRLQSGSDVLSVVPILKNEKDICLRLTLSGASEMSDLTRDFDFVVYDGPTFKDREQASILARAVDRIAVVSAAHATEPSLDDIAGWLDVAIAKISRVIAIGSGFRRAA